MSDADEGNPAPSGQESPADEAGAGASVAGAEGMEILDSGPHGEVPGEEGVTGAVGGLGVEAMEMVDPQIRIRQEIADIEAAGEGANSQYVPDMPVDLRQFSVATLQLMVLELMESVLRRVHHNDHILTRPRVSGRVVQAMDQVPRSIALSLPRGSLEGAAAMVPEGAGDAAMGSGEGAPGPMGSGEGARASEPEDQPETDVHLSAACELGEEAEEAEDQPEQEAEDPEETSKYQSENAEEEARDAERKEEKEESTEKGPERNVDPAEAKPRNPSLEE